MKVLRREDGRNHHLSTWTRRLLTTVHQPTQSMMEEKQMGVKIMTLFSVPCESEEQLLAWVICASFRRMWYFHFALAAQESRHAYVKNLLTANMEEVVRIKSLSCSLDSCGILTVDAMGKYFMPAMIFTIPQEKIIFWSITQSPMDMLCLAQMIWGVSAEEGFSVGF